MARSGHVKTVGFGERLKLALRAAGMSQAELAVVAHAAALLGAIALWAACRYLLDLEAWPVVGWAAVAWAWAAIRAGDAPR